MLLGLAALTVGSVAIDDGSDLRGEGLKILMGEQVDVPQTARQFTRPATEI
jgi:hypothetical protein